jgi:hypothetical protein
LHLDAGEVISVLAIEHVRVEVADETGAVRLKRRLRHGLLEIGTEPQLTDGAGAASRLKPECLAATEVVRRDTRLRSRPSAASIDRATARGGLV